MNLLVNLLVTYEKWVEAILHNSGKIKPCLFVFTINNTTSLFLVLDIPIWISNYITFSHFNVPSIFPEKVTFFHHPDCGKKRVIIFILKPSKL